MTTRTARPDHVRQLLVATIAALAIAGASGVVLLARGDLDDTGWRVLATSASLGLACTVGAAGADLARRRRPYARRIGTLAMFLAGAAYALFAVTLWSEIDGERFGQATASVAILALEAGHASFVLARTRADDRDGVRLLVAVSLITTALSAAAGLWLVWHETATDRPLRLAGILLIVQLVTAIVPSLLRRVQRRASRSPGLADELDAIADRLERATTAGAARGEAGRLHELAAASRD